MKKGLYITLSLFAAFAIIMTGCPEPQPTINRVTIVFNTDNGSAVDSIKINKGGSLPTDYFGAGSRVPTRTSHRFNCWLDGTTPVTAATTFSRDTTLIAQWVRQVIVSFSLGEGVAGTPPVSVTIDASTALGTRFPSAIPSRGEGWGFNGWYNGDTRYINNTVINTAAAEFILTARWEEETDEVEYAQSPAIHPGNHFQEIAPGGVNAQVNIDFSVGGLFSNIENGAGVLTSQWYRATTATGEGEEIDYRQAASPGNPHELSLPFTWREPVAGEYWYWVVVTNTNVNATIQQISSSVTQNRLKVTVSD